VASNLKAAKAVGLAVAGVVCSVIGFEAIDWLAHQFPSVGPLILKVGVGAVAILVALIFLYPILALYGLVEPASQSLSWLRRHRRNRGR
jgi:hypothetical protein